MVGIYKITSPTEKVYIGQSRNICKRKSSYKNFRCPKQYKLYRSLIKYGWEAHKFEVIHELPKDITQEVLDNYEILYWSLYKDCGIDMMNIKAPGKYAKQTSETKEKLRIANNKRLASGWLPSNSIKFYQYSLLGELLYTHPSMSSIKGLNSSIIRRKYTQYSTFIYHNFLWSPKLMEDIEIINSITNFNKIPKTRGKSKKYGTK